MNIKDKLKSKSLTEGLTLFIPDKPDVERDSVALAWEKSGGKVIRIGKFWEPPSGISEGIKIYGYDSFSLVLAQKLNLCLISPDDKLLLSVPKNLINRNIECKSLSHAMQEKFPVFIKPSTPKLFRANIYNNKEELNSECKGLSGNTDVLISKILKIESEARCFINNDTILDCSIYEGNQNLNEAKQFCEKAMKSIVLPKTCVIDIGYIGELGWSIIEFNASWGSGLNGCNALKILPAIINATEP